MKYIFFIIPSILSIPYNSICKMNEIFNKTLKKCVNSSMYNITYANYYNNDTIDSSHRILQRDTTEDLVAQRLARVAQPTWPIKIIKIEHFSNMGEIHRNDDIYFYYLIVAICYIAYCNRNRINNFLR